VPTVFRDNFETDRGWIVSPNGTDTATDGMWERGNPVGNYENGIKQLDVTTSGNCNLVTGASFGAGDVDDGITSIRSPNVVLPKLWSGENLELGFSYYLAHTAASASTNYLRVTVVGATTSSIVYEELAAAINDDGVWENLVTDPFIHFIR
jgi:hypothetical protein